MREKKTTFFCTLFFLTVLPFVFTILFQGIGTVPFLATEFSLQVAKRENQQAISEQKKPETKEELIAAAKQEQENDQLLGILANQISADAPSEAIKAQCVIARTEAAYAREHEQQPPKGRLTKELHQIWQTAYEENRSKFLLAIEETDGEVLSRENEVIYAAYHAVSAGKTRCLQEADEQKEYAAWNSVECPMDREADGYLQVFVFSPEEVCQKLEQQNPDCGLKADQIFSDLQILQRDSTEYVTMVKVGKTELSGETFRKEMNLPSANFSFSNKDGNLRIVTKGIGHGFGLSQYTAIQMAKNGENYQTILKYFFEDVEIM